MGHIIWLASYPKSGNTWLRVFLANLVDQRPKPQNINELGDFAPGENLGAFYQPFFEKPVAEASLAELARVRPHVHRAIAASTKGFVFLKTHFLLGNHLGTPTITREVTAGAIYIVRNPLDVAVSYSAFMNRPLEQTIEIMSRSGAILPRPPTSSYQLTGSWSENVLTWTRHQHDRLLVVRYEDLIDSPRKEFERIIKFLGINVSKEIIEAAQANSSFETLRNMELKFGFGERPTSAKEFFRAGLTDQWQERFNDELLSKLIRANVTTMTKFGYLDQRGRPVAASSGKLLRVDAQP